MKITKRASGTQLSMLPVEESGSFAGLSRHAVKSKRRQITLSLRDAAGLKPVTWWQETRCCLTCAKDFHPHRPTSQYCSNPCWMKSGRKAALITKARAAGKYDEAHIQASKRMKKRNPMKRAGVAERQSATTKLRIANGAIIPFACTPDGKKIISAAARKRMLGPDNPMKNPETMMQRLGIRASDSRTVSRRRLSRF